MWGRTFKSPKLHSIDSVTKVLKNLDGLFRFLQIRGVVNGQILNASNIARDSGVSRTTVNGHFEILTDTLIGNKLPAYEKQISVKEVTHPKFYLFDAGVARCLSHTLRSPMDSFEKGFLFETIILNELKAFNSYNDLGGQFSFWATNPKGEVDIIWTQGKKHIGFEIKTNKTWKSEFSKSTNKLRKREII